ncbi:ras-related protein Rab-19-like [Tachysurus ichikawai]
MWRITLQYPSRSWVELCWCQLGGNNNSINTEHWTGCASLTAQPSGMEQEDCFDFLFKIILIGDTDVGKTSVIQRFKTGNFSERQQSTIGVDFIV